MELSQPGGSEGNAESISTSTTSALVTVRAPADPLRLQRGRRLVDGGPPVAHTVQASEPRRLLLLLWLSSEDTVLGQLNLDVSALSSALIQLIESCERGMRQNSKIVRASLRVAFRMMHFKYARNISII